MKEKTNRRSVSRREFLRLSALTMGGAALAACAVPTAAPTGEGEVAVREPVELRWWANPFTEDDITNVWEPITEKFYAAGHDDIRIETEIMPWSDRRQKMMTAYAGGRAADVACMNVDMIWNFADAGALAPLDDYIPAEVVSDTPALTELCYLDGNLYMIPYNTGPFGYLYNPDLLSQSGWQADSPPVTWDSLRELGPMAKEQGLYSVLLEVHGAAWFYTLWGNNGRVLQEDEAGNIIGSGLDSEAVRETWQFHKEHYDNEWSPIEFVTMQVTPQMPNYFLQGQMVISGLNTAQDASLLVSQAEGMPIEVLPQPFANERPATGSSDGSVAMYSTSENPEAGGEWLTFVMSPEILAEWSNLGGYIPSRESARESEVWNPADIVRKFGELAPYVATNKDRYFFFSQAIQLVNPELQAYILDGKSLDEAIMTAHAALDALIKEDLPPTQGG